MVVLVFVNVCPHVFGGDVAWTTELAEFMMVWVTFLGGAAATRRGAHMRITEFLDKLAGRRRAVGGCARSSRSRSLVLGLLVWFGVGIVAASRATSSPCSTGRWRGSTCRCRSDRRRRSSSSAWDLVQIVRGRRAAERYGA